MPTTRRPREIITLGDDGRPVKVPYTGDDLPPWLIDFLACLGMVGIVGIVFVLALWLAPR